VASLGLSMPRPTLLSPMRLSLSRMRSARTRSLALDSVMMRKLVRPRSIIMSQIFSARLMLVRKLASQILRSFLLLGSWRRAISSTTFSALLPRQLLCIWSLAQKEHDQGQPREV